MRKAKLLILIIIIFSAGCSSLPIISRGKRYSDFEISSHLYYIERTINEARDSYNSGDLDQTRIFCDDVIKKLFNIKNAIDVNEYERLHTDIALLRLKTNQTRHSKVSTIKSDLFPLVWNSRVEKWINFFTGRGRPDFIRCVERSKKFIKAVKKILYENEIPLDLAYVPIIESGYYPFARSRAGAVGLWQFMKVTAKLNGLKINEWLDERRDPNKATEAAVRELKNLYSEFGTWELALAAYNYGANGVRKRIKKWNTNDYWELYLPRETENFVPKIMAVIFIMREPGLFGFKPFYSGDEEHLWKEYEVGDSVDLRDVAKWSGVDIKEIQFLNPELMQMCTPPGKKYNIRIPVNAYERFVTKFNEFDNKEKYLTKQELDRRIRKVVYYRVRRGDSLWGIAKKFRVSVRSIRKWNNLASNRIYPKQRLKISPRKSARYSSYYKVRSGDTLLGIAKKFGVTLNNIKKWNNLASDMIYPNQQLKVSLSDTADSPVYYRVRRGDTLLKIAKKFRVSLYNIKKWNNLTSNMIYPRQKLKIFPHGA